MQEVHARSADRVLVERVDGCDVLGDEAIECLGASRGACLLVVPATDGSPGETSDVTPRHMRNAAHWY
jgi:hypothetical protein